MMSKSIRMKPAKDDGELEDRGSELGVTLTPLGVAQFCSQPGLVVCAVN